MLDSSPQFRMIELDETTSTNSFLADYHPLRPTELTLVTADYQTAGRGQTGNTWESERGKNLLFSLLLCPKDLLASQMFLISEAIVLAIRDAIDAILREHSSKSLPEVTIKWPNDVYVGNHKIAGILIENTLCGQYVGSSIIGCGINVNQAFFHSDAPNPVSLCQLLGLELERSFVLDAVITRFRRNLSSLATLHPAYLSALYRREGFHPFILPSSSTPFLAEIADVEPSGHLVLRDTEGTLLRFAFKEVSYVINC